MYVFVPYRPDLLVRAARHYEGAGQILLRKAVMSARQFVLTGQSEMPPMGEWQEVECPARLDLSGEFRALNTQLPFFQVPLTL